MFKIDMMSHETIYEQITNNFKELIHTDVLKPEEKLPSVRELSKVLTVNPNTIQKAIKNLEQQGYVYTVSGIGTFVKPQGPEKNDPKILEDIKTKLRSSLKELLFIGYSVDETKKLIDELIYERKGWK